MDVVVDSDPDYTLSREYATVIEAFAEIVAHLEAAGRGVLALTVDGETIDPERVSDLLGSRPVGKTGRIEVRSAEIAALAAETLRELAAVLPELPAACHSLAEVVQNSALDDEAKGALHELLTLWSAIAARERQVLKSLGLSASGILVDGVLLADRFRDMETLFGKAAAAADASDAATLGDLLAYEFAPRAEIEQEICSTLLARVSSG